MKIIAPPEFFEENLLEEDSPFIMYDPNKYRVKWIAPDLLTVEPIPKFDNGEELIAFLIIIGFVVLVSHIIKACL
jgi:hypothetical protein